MCQNGVRGFSFVALMLLFVMQSAMAMDSSAKSKVTIPYKDGANIWVKSSADHPVTFLELYSSQGCYSCPPAERWINTFVDDNRLWDTLIPVNFHVDYWDYLGWKDPFATPTFTLRQRKYERLKDIQQVATPGFVVSGKGWNGWFRRRPLPSYSQSRSIGHLQAKLVAEKITLNYKINTPGNILFKSNNPKVHVAILGFDIVVPIEKGENSGLDFKHDFVVLAYQQVSMIQTKNEWRTQLKKPVPNSNLVRINSTNDHLLESNANKRAIVIWVSEGNKPKPLQVTGGWL